MTRQRPAKRDARSRGRGTSPPAPPVADTRGGPASRRASSRMRGVAIALAALVLLAAGAWWLWPRPTAPDAGPDVLLVTIDTVRADHVGCYGDRRAATPVMDGLAARGVRFEEAVAQVPLTLPSHASILTGVTPLVHGVRDNAGFALGPRPRTLAEAFRDAGYRTAAFVSGFPVHHRFGLGRGFGTYDDRFPRGSDPARPTYIERRAGQTVGEAARWLETTTPTPGTAPAPVFVWVHLFDPHAPYEPPEPQASRFRDRPYDGEIAYADQQLGVLLDRWRTLRAGRNPVVLVTSDHGEGLGDHGEPTHGLFIYDSTIRVPLVVAGPGVPAGRVVTGAVRSIDIAPTLLDLAGRAPLAGIEGVSLRASFESRRAPGEAAYSESLFARLGFGWAPLYGWRDRGLMLIDAPRPELYDLASDSTEARNLATDRTADLARMRRAVQAAVSKGTEARPSAVGREAGEQLRSLGYVASGPIARPSLRDPKDFASLAVRIENAMALERANPAAAAAEFRAALKEDPGNVVARRHVAVALAAARQYDEAIRELRPLFDAGENSLEMLILLGDCHRLSGRHDAALEAYGRAVHEDPSAAEGFDGEGKSLTALGRVDEARRAFEEAVRVAPDDPDGLEGLADLALARGDLAEARSRLAALAARDPGDARVALKHGVVLVRTGDLDRAITTFRDVLEREPSNAEAAVDLGGALAKAGRPADAVGYFERAVAAGARSPVVWNGLAMARLETGDRAGAVQALRESLRARPDQPNIKEWLDRIR
jgi:choline-sulfatase